MLESGAGDPATLYRLRVGGVVPPGWENRLGGLQVVQEEASKLEDTTTLIGEMTDQAELLGVLNTLHQLQLALLLVEAIEVGLVSSLSEFREPAEPTSKP